jgi:hypothetical protein
MQEGLWCQKVAQIVLLSLYTCLKKVRFEKVTYSKVYILG